MKSGRTWFGFSWTTIPRVRSRGATAGGGVPNMTSSQTSTRAAVPAQLDFHTPSIPETLPAEEGDEQRGLSTAQAEERRRADGPNPVTRGGAEAPRRAVPGPDARPVA